MTRREITVHDQIQIVSSLAKGRSLQLTASRLKISVQLVKAVGEAHGWPELGKLVEAHDRLAHLGPPPAKPEPAKTASSSSAPAGSIVVLVRAAKSESKRLVNRGARITDLINELEADLDAWDQCNGERLKLEAEISKHREAIAALTAKLKAGA